MASCITLTGKNLELATDVSNELGYKLPFIGAKLNSWISANNEQEAIDKGEYRLPSKEELINHIKSTTGDYISSTFVHNIEEVSAIDKVHKVYDPQTKIDRSVLVSNMFTRVVDNLQRVNPDLSREEVINKETPQGIFNAVKSSFEKSLTIEGLDPRRAAEFKKVLDNFSGLAELSTSYLKITEGLKFDVNSLKIAKANLSADPSDQGEIVEPSNTQSFKEEQVKDGWMINFRHLSANESLSQNVRRVLSNIVKNGFDGEPEVDDLGFERHIPADYAFNSLMRKLSGMTKDTHLMPMLEELATKKSWVYDIIDTIADIDGNHSKEQLDLQSQFYSNFRKDFVPLWIQKPFINAAGNIGYKTVQINATQGVGHLLSEIRDNYESGTRLTSNAIYNTDGRINKENIDANLVKTNNLLKEYKGLELLAKDTSEVHNEILGAWIEKNISSIQDLSKSIGIDIDTDTLNQALTYTMHDDSAKLKLTPSVEGYLDTLRGIFANVKSGEKDELGNESRIDLKAQSKSIGSLAEKLANVADDSIESSVNENGKSHYSHLVPSYIGKLIKNFQISHGNMTDFKEFIGTEFAKYNWFYDAEKKQFRGDWLRQLADLGDEGTNARNLLQRKSLLHFDNVSYSDLTETDYTLALINEYFSDSTNKSAYYHVPILADAPSAEFIKFKKYIDGNLTPTGSYKEHLLNQFVELANQELDRITLVNNRKPLIADGTVKEIDNFDKNGNKFQFFPKLNDIIDKIKDLATSGEPLAGEKINRLMRDTIESSINESFDKRLKEWDEMGLFETKSKEDNTLKILETPNARRLVRGKELGDIQGATRADLENYFWNSFHATSQIIQLTTTDMAYYKSIEDFQKRNKQIYAPAIRLNTKSQYGRTVERTMYLKDHEIASRNLEHIDTILESKIKNKSNPTGTITPLNKANIMAQFGGANLWTKTVDGKVVSISRDEFNSIKNNKTLQPQSFYSVKVDGKTYKSVTKSVNETDAQAYRSLSSRRAVADMAGQWTSQMQHTYDNFKKGTWDMQDFNTLWNAEKPFLYTQTEVNSGVDGQVIKVPVQNKNSETLLLMMGLMGKSPELSALEEFMEKNQIDVVQFESAVKEGGQGKVNINDLGTKETILDRLTSKMQEPDTIHELNYEDYGIQNTVPEHLMDSEALYGTQIRKLSMADISDDLNFRLNLDMGDGTSKQLTKKEALDLYNQLHVDNIVDSYKEAKTIFGSNQEIEKLLLEEVKGSKRFGIDMVRAVTLNDKGEFTIPLNEPSQALRVQSLLNSIIKDRITKQKMNGGNAVQVSDFGLADDLHIVFEGEGADKRIKHFECYMPWYSKRYYEPLIDSKTGTLDINKLPEGPEGDELRKLIGYRIPTEDKYSMTPLYIKGFLPQQLGGAIMLPSEITTISGSDFDIDKLFLMIPNFEVTHKKAEANAIKALYGELKNREEFKGNTPKEIKDKLLTIVQQKINGEQFTKGSIEDRASYYLDQNKSSIPMEPTAQKVKYNWDIGSQNNSKEARDNMLQDLTRSVLTSSDTASKMLNPGGFDSLKSSARLVTLLDNMPVNELRDLAKSHGFNHPYDYLKSLTLEEASDLASKYKEPLNMLDPRTQVKLHQRNMNAAKLIGIFANHNANHALMQHTELELTRDNHYTDAEGNVKTINGGAYTLNNKNNTSLHDIKAADGSFISRNMAVPLAASVDAVKDPVLSDLNMNTFTADLASFLIRNGHSHDTVSLLLRQPIIRDITTEYYNRVKEGDRKDDIIDDVLNRYNENSDPRVTERYKNQLFLDKDMAMAIAVSREAKAMTEEERAHHSDLDIRNYYNNQINVGYLFKHLMANGDILGDLVNATKADTSNGGAGPTNADTLEKLRKVDDYLDKITPSPETVPLNKRKRILLNNAHVVDNSLDFNNPEELRSKLLDSKLPYIQAFYSLGLKESQTMMGQHFPTFNPEFKAVFNQFADITKSGKLDAKTINNIQNDLYAYIMTGKRFLGGSNEEMRAKRNAFINEFIPEYTKIIQNNPDIAKLDIIKALQVQKSSDIDGLTTLISRSVGDLSQAAKENITNSWTSLFYMGEQGQQLAMNLFQYAFYRNGFAFNNNSFMHLAPTVIKEAAPEYLNTIRDLARQNVPKDQVDTIYQHFMLQYLRNHSDNRRFVPSIDPTESRANIFNTNKELNNNFTITVDRKTSSLEDKKFTSVNNDQEIRWVPLVSIPYKGGEELFVNDNYLDDSKNGNDTATYTRIDPLGAKNNFLEYEMDTPHNEISSVINRDVKAPSIDSNSYYSESDLIPDFDEYKKNNPQQFEETPRYTEYDQIKKEEDSARQAIEQQFGEGSTKDISDNIDDKIKDYYKDQEYKRRLEEDNIC